MAKVSIKEIKQAIIDDLEGKKPFTSYKHIYCGLCSGDIEEGDEFFYLGDNKICNDCRSLAAEIIETKLYL